MRNYRKKRITHWNAVFSKSGLPKSARHYHKLLEQYYSFQIPTGMRVLELGCGNGSLLASVKPEFGVGVDFSRQALIQAKQLHPQLSFIEADVCELPLSGSFDVIILSDLVNDLWDVQTVLELITRCSHSRTRVILNLHSHLWQVLLAWAERLGLKRPTLAQNWFTLDDLHTLLKLTNCDLIKHETEILLPAHIPVLSWFANKYLARIWPFSALCLTNMLVIRPLKAKLEKRSQQPSVSIIIPARNEEGNIGRLFSELPKLGRAMELVFIEGHSKDKTYEAIEEAIQQHPEQKAQLLKQTGVGKANAVWQGFAAAKNDVLIIFDSDLSVSPPDLLRFYEAVSNNKGEFINGSRLVYPMEDRAMQFINLIGNRLFGKIFSWLISQPVKDTLCGTKVIWREDFALLRQVWPENSRDPFGDFDLLIGSAKLNLKIIDVPIRYRERTYGSTNINRWSHGLMLIRMLSWAASSLKFR
ncbi:MAG: glycosyltransferase [Anaerolineales bacterium]|nr:glycosyltransferase [Anaerolineales bacterium]MCW5856307.1 glycosyltransferase [Anaerolineales bacterium]